MWQIVKFNLINIICSVAIGLAVGFALSYSLDKPSTRFLIESGIIGIIIGITVKFSVIIFHRYFQLNSWRGYSLVFIISGLLSLAAAQPLPMMNKITILAVVEPLALFTAFLNHNYFQRLNKGLKRNQARVKENIPDNP